MDMNKFQWTRQPKSYTVEAGEVRNTVSSMAPTQAPSKKLDRAHIEPGIWNVLPVIHGDHVWLQGGLLRKHDIRRIYMDLLGMIDKLGDAIEKNG